MSYGLTSYACVDRIVVHDFALGVQTSPVTQIIELSRPLLDLPQIATLRNLNDPNASNNLLSNLRLPGLDQCVATWHNQAHRLDIDEVESLANQINRTLL